MASARIIQFIGGHEGKVLTYYLDPVHVPTIGYGFTWSSKIFQDWWMAHYGRRLKKGDTMTEAQALEVLKLVVEKEAEPPVQAKFPNAVAWIKEAATSMVYNAGKGSLAWNWATQIRQGNIKEGCALWRTTATTAKGKKLPGLVRRRQEEADIAEFNKWPAWMGDVSTYVPASQIEAPATHITVEDVKQAQQWLNSLGYNAGAIDGVPGPQTTTAVKMFQQEHGTLKVDGIIGPATLSALQRAVEAKKKIGAAVGTGGTITAGGVADSATNADQAVDAPDWLDGLLIWGGVAIIVVVVVYLAWRYKDEINALLRRL